MNPRIEILTLELFIAVIEERSIARAGERRNIAVSAVSRRISDLESLLQVQLLHRRARGVEPTAAGYAFAGACADRHRQCDAAAHGPDRLSPGNTWAYSPLGQQIGDPRGAGRTAHPLPEGTSADQDRSRGKHQPADHPVGRGKTGRISEFSAGTSRRRS
ncbi:MAG: LysR family transcriptional regulator [Acetobacteraceae bacterium]